MSEEKENVLIHKEKPYYTEDEQKLYYRIAIDEALKQGNEQMANHYMILLKLLETRSAEENSLFKKLMERRKPSDQEQEKQSGE